MMVQQNKKVTIRNHSWKSKQLAVIQWFGFSILFHQLQGSGDQLFGLELGGRGVHLGRPWGVVKRRR